MRTLPVCFVIFKFWGLWRPSDYLSWMKILYNIYSLLIVVIMYSFMLFEFIDVFINIKSIDDFTMNSFMLVTFTNACWRVAKILAGRGKILKVINLLTSDYCVAVDKREVEIKEGYDGIARWNTLRYVILVQITVALMLIVPLSNESRKRILPFRSWLPYDLSSLKLFWLSYVHQCIAIMAAAYINVATDSFISGLMIQICSQLDILKYRLIKLPRLYNINHRDEFLSSLTHCVLHHEHIFKFASAVESVSNPITIVQFCASAVALCSSVYQLSKHSVDSAKFMPLILYLLCMLFQLFFYCWYGNEVILKSMEVRDAVYEMDWILLDNNNKKALLMMMKRSERSIQIKSGYFIALSVEPYIKILKASFTAYNALQQISN
ncbi:Odorant receptor 44 [Cephus cinctus]|uniref:Odorant receptor n=1 Tax=Cephus cinctus TaxID=211228 RepID=S5TD96_CEPCN|nr:odorant receptor Or1-like [Cephus cinctus]XP_024946410.1 odorant receptor Or1-like isoform X1 [Cephus cinctus]XP_024946411.1 odorant receptor Or1-like isoform X1 [Cephus cinctus]AGS43072.1 odorant receptor Or4a [Cephus cinctus]RLZ02261.1 Odorant receptor 44 [Cephus cinctus]